MAKTKTNKRFLELPLDPADVNLGPSQIVSILETELGSGEWKTQKTEEEIQDILGAALTGGTQTNITVTYNDATGVIDFNVTGGGGGGLTQEEVEDITNSLIQTSSDLQSTYDDNVGTLTISLSSALTAKLTNLPADQATVNTNLQSSIDSKLDSIVGGTNVTVDNTDPQNPIINASGSGTSTWGGITGILSSQTDLQSALDGKVDDVQILTDVPAGAVFTDTVYDDTAIQASVTANTTASHADDDVETVTGTLVDNTDVRNPIVNIPTTTQLGLENVDNTSDTDKPISTATQTALDGKLTNFSLTTSGSSGAATFNANVLNIPQYSGAGTTNNYNNSYTDYGGSSLAGNIDALNDTFTVSQGAYRGGSLQVIVEGVTYYSGAGLTETNPGGGVFTFDTAPDTGDQIAAFYEVGSIGTGNLNSIVAGANITVDNTDPVNPIINSSGGSSSEVAELLVPTAQNTLPNLSQAPANLNIVKVFINGQLADNLPSSGVSVNGTGAITVNSTDLGYNIETTHRVVAYYTV